MQSLRHRNDPCSEKDVAEPWPDGWVFYDDARGG
jgi:hypothetical protein